MSLQVLYAGHTVAAYYVGIFGNGLTNAAMTLEEREALSHFPDSKEYKDRVGGSKAQILVWVVYTTLLWVSKTCMLFFYSRLTYVCTRSVSNPRLLTNHRENVDRMRPRIQIGFVLLPCSYVVLLCVELFGCHPFRKHWQIYPDPGGKLTSTCTFSSLAGTNCISSGLLPLAFHAQSILYDNS